ncbi:MAG TPA: methylmalonyl-CoA mutase family protein, partial [Candidatus Methylomirabilis sp.]|nr:methylmalonyl-CoA mutase family protein [Candidatus Methylomirabilis sp.]
AEEQCQRLQTIRARRDDAQVQQALRRLAEVAAGPANLLPPLLETVQAYATIGEICDTLRSIFGVHQEAVVL